MEHEACSFTNDCGDCTKGSWVHANMGGGLEGLSLYVFTKAFGWSATQVHDLLVEVRKDMADRSIHAYWPM